MQRFEQIYAEQHDAVRAYVRRRVAEDAVDDIVSETFLVCWRKLDRVPEEALPWLYAVARKTIANHRRKLARQAPPRAAAGGEPEPVGDGALAAAFAALSERDREVLRLVAWEGLSLREASAVPAAAFAGRLGDLLGISNEGTAVSTSQVLPGQDKLDQALADMRVGSTMQLLGTLNGVSFYAARNADGQFCLAIDHVQQTYEK